MNENELKKYLQRNYPIENEACEWKEYKSLKHSVSGSQGDDIVSYVSAIANMNGGQLVIGVEDLTLNIIGIKDFHTYNKINIKLKILHDCTNLSSEDFEIEEFITDDTNKTIWIIHIPKHSYRLPVYAHKKSWQRIGDSLVEMTSVRLNTILSELQSLDDWSAKICEEATINDLEPIALQKARDEYKIKHTNIIDEIDTWDDITFLNKAKVCIQGKITRTAVLLLGKPESEHFLDSSIARITWILKDKDNIEKDYRHFSCPFILSVKNIFKLIRNLKYRYLQEGKLFPEEVDQYDPYIIREALNNCVAHQDYSLMGRINVVESEDNSLIFSNVGSFIPESIINVIEQDAPQEFYRNPFLIRAMVNLNMIDSIGSGIKRIFSIQRKKFFPMPDYDLKNNKVKVILLGKVINAEYSRVLAQNSELGLFDAILLDKVQKNKVLSKEEIKYLRKKKLIEGRKPNFYISSEIARDIGQKADYIKLRGFKDDHYKKMIIDYIGKYKFASKRDISKLIYDMLPNILTHEQKEKKIGNLIYSMSKKDRTILNNGTNRNPRWVNFS